MENKEFDFHEIKTFEYACKHLGLNSGSLTYPAGGDRDSFLRAWYFYKLLIIQRAINDIDCNNEPLCRCHPFWQFYTAEELEELSQSYIQTRGIRSIASYSSKLYTGISKVRSVEAPYVGTYLNMSYVYPFCFNSPEAALYVGRQFEDLFFRYYGIKLKS